MTQTDTFLYQEIAESLRQQIAAGQLHPDDRLPSVREMARRWNCTPGTVSRAYAQLAREGLVAAHRGSGTRVLPNILHPTDPTWQWASLVNLAEKFLLEGLAGGHTPAQVRTALSLAISRWEELQQDAPSATIPDTTANGLRFAGSHDLSVQLLVDYLAEESPPMTLSCDFVGSLGGLIALARNEADLAGIHLWDEQTDRYNLPFLARVLPGRTVIPLTLVHRTLGLILPPGNPLALTSPADLARPEVRLINRQPGSGTRVWLDARVTAAGLDPAAIDGYQEGVTTHLAVARAVAEGRANVGLGIHAAAAAYGLDFVPLTRERYDLVFTEEAWGSVAGEALVRQVRSTRFKEAVRALGGYDLSETGHRLDLTATDRLPEIDTLT